jgi:hypothetical protein
MYVVIKKTARKILDQIKFENRKDAERFAEFSNATALRGVRYVVEERNQ